MSRPKWIDWDAQPLGAVSDAEIASRLGVHHGSVASARLRRGIPAMSRPRARRNDLRAPKGIDWDAQPLGAVSDDDLAERLGVSRQCVEQARRRRGIEPECGEIDRLLRDLGLVRVEIETSLAPHK